VWWGNYRSKQRVVLGFAVVVIANGIGDILCR